VASFADSRDEKMDELIARQLLDLTADGAPAEAAAEALDQSDPSAAIRAIFADVDSLKEASANTCCH